VVVVGVGAVTGGGGGRGRGEWRRRWPWPSHDMIQVVLLGESGRVGEWPTDCCHALLLSRTPRTPRTPHTPLTRLPHNSMAHYCGWPLSSHGSQSASQPLNHPRTLRTGSGPAGEAYREHCSRSGANLQQKSLKRPAVKVGEGEMHQCMCIVALVRLRWGLETSSASPLAARRRAAPHKQCLPTYQHTHKHSACY
jgi:hypothetical protein